MRINSVNTENYTEAYMSQYYALECELACATLQYEQLACIEDFLCHEKWQQQEMVTLEDVQMDNNGNKNQPAANGVLGKAKQAAGNAWKAIVDFIKKIVNAFINKAQDLIQSNEEWVSKNINKVDGITNDFWADCTITCLPYFLDTGNATSLGDDLNVLIKDSSMGHTKVNDKNTTDYDLLADVSPTISKYDTEKNGNAGEAAKKYFRQDANEKAYNGDKARIVCGNMKKYVQGYKALTDKLKAQANNIAKKIEAQEKKATPQGATESFVAPDDPMLYSILEDNFVGTRESDCPYEVLGPNGNALIVLEEVQMNNNNPTTGGGQGNEKLSTGSTIRNINRSLVRVNRMKSAIIAAKLTIAEECYNCCIRTLKAIVRNAESRGNINNAQRSSNATGEGEQQQQQKPAKPTNTKPKTYPTDNPAQG